MAAPPAPEVVVVRPVVGSSHDPPRPEGAKKVEKTRAEKEKMRPLPWPKHSKARPRTGPLAARAHRPVPFLHPMLARLRLEKRRAEKHKEGENHEENPVKSEVQVLRGRRTQHWHGVTGWMYAWHAAQRSEGRVQMRDTFGAIFYETGSLI